MGKEMEVLSTRMSLCKKPWLEGGKEKEGKDQVIQETAASLGGFSRSFLMVCLECKEKTERGRKRGQQNTSQRTTPSAAGFHSEHPINIAASAVIKQETGRARGKREHAE